MNPWIAIILISGTTGLVAYRANRRARASTQSDSAE